MKDVSICLVCGDAMKYTLKDALTGRINICDECRSTRDKTKKKCGGNFGRNN
jgi:hypothetical protein